MTPHSSEPTDRATDKESVCFVVVSYNNEHTITECIDSLLQQTIPPSRIVVVDNASQDRTVHLLADYPKVQLVKMERNTGFPAACNAGAKLSTEQLLAFVNPDASITPTWTEEMIRGLSRLTNAGAITSRILTTKPRIPAQEIINADGNDMNFLGFAWCRNLGLPKIRSDGRAEVLYPSGAAMLVRREAFLTVQGFDSDLFLYHDDVDLGLRLRLAGWEIYLVPKAEAFHDYQFIRNKAKWFFLERNRLIVVLKIFGVRTLILILPAIFVGEIAVLFNSATTGWFGLKMQSYLSFLSTLSSTLAKRRLLQNVRKVPDSALIRLMTGRISHPYLTNSRLAASFNLFLDKYRTTLLDPQPSGFA